MSPTCEFIVFAPKYTQLHACGYTHAHTLFQTHSHNDTTRANVPTHTCTNRPEAYTSAHSNVIDLNDNTVIAKFERNTHTYVCIPSYGWFIVCGIFGIVAVPFKFFVCMCADDIVLCLHSQYHHEDVVVYKFICVFVYTLALMGE